MPSPVFISAMLPWCSATAPITWTSKCRCPIVRLAASRTLANASGSRSSRVSPASSRSRNSAVLPASSASDRSSTSGSYVLTSSAMCASCFFLRPSPIWPSFSMTMLRLGVGRGWNPYGTGGLEPDRAPGGAFSALGERRRGLAHAERRTPITARSTTATPSPRTRNAAPSKRNALVERGEGRAEAHHEVVEPEGAARSYGFGEVADHGGRPRKLADQPSPISEQADGDRHGARVRSRRGAQRRRSPAPAEEEPRPPCEPVERGPDER